MGNSSNCFSSLLPHVGKEKVETSSLCHSQCWASSHTSATQFLCCLFLKRDWSPHRNHRQKMTMTPASRALVIISEVMVSK